MRLFYLLVCLIASGSVMALNEKNIYGYVEKVNLLDHNLVLSAKLDTGAKSASLHAINIQQIKENDKIFLTFTVPSKQGPVNFRSEYLGKVKIKTRAQENGKLPLEPIKRPVVNLKMQLGKEIAIIRVNLTNRK